jgi:hypothetical protein
MSPSKSQESRMIIPYGLRKSKATHSCPDAFPPRSHSIYNKVPQIILIHGKVYDKMGIQKKRGALHWQRFVSIAAVNWSRVRSVVVRDRFRDLRAIRLLRPPNRPAERRATGVRLPNQEATIANSPGAPARRLESRHAESSSVPGSRPGSGARPIGAVAFARFSFA